MNQYHDLVRHVLETGTRKENRTGVDTISTCNYNYKHDLRDGFPLLTTKKIKWSNIVVELLWFLSGQTDIAILKRHGCRFWDSWADPVTGRVPSAYGSFWRAFPTHGEPEVVRGILQQAIAAGPRGIEFEEDLLKAAFPANDQIAWVLAELRRNPMSRRMVVSAWAPGNAQTSKLPPCHAMWMLNVQNEPWVKLTEAGIRKRAYPMIPRVGGNDPDTFQTPEEREEGSGVTQRLCLHLTQRSCDVALGVPYNLASYALLLELFARFANIQPGIFGHTLVDAHIYTSKPDGSMAEYDHVPGLREQIARDPRPLPKLHISEEIKDLADIERLMHPSVSTEEVMRHFVLEGYDPHPAISFKVAV
jgi:thymidylate synthase